MALRRRSEPPSRRWSRVRRGRRPRATPAAVTCSGITAGKPSPHRWKPCTKNYKRRSSSMFDNITPLVITYNEAPNIARTLNKLSWAKRIVVIDSGSTDATLDLLRGYPRVVVIHHPFSDFATQCNFGLTQIDTPWVLSLDADYELSNGLVDEIGAFTDTDSVGAYRVPFVYRIYGRPLRGTLYPPRVVLCRAAMARYVNE